MKKIRQEFVDTMLEVGLIDPRLVVLVGDISHFSLVPFAKRCPDRYYNIGVCEQTIVNMAAGLTKVGLHPVVHTIAAFIVERAFEQIKDDFGYQQLGVNIVCIGGGFDITRLGCTHHCYGDFALLKTIPRMQIIYPGSALEFNLLFKQTYANGLPTYFRIQDAQHGYEFKKNQIKVGFGIKVISGSDLTIIALGPQLKTALATVPQLKKIKLSAEVIYLPTVKPLDVKLIRASLTKTKRCLVIEEHSRYGGVFDDILRITCDLGQIKYAGLNLGDQFIHEYGSYEELCIYAGLTVSNLVTTVKRKLLSK